MREMIYKPTAKLNHESDVVNSTYTKVSLAYFDILGFSEFLSRNCTESPRALMQVFYEILTSIENEFGISTQTMLHYKVISDGFILWFDSQDDEFFARLIQITYFTRRYFNKELFLIRGAIVKGDHYINGDIMVSPALVKAVILEKSTRLPKIMIEKDEAIKLRQAVLAGYEKYSQDVIWLKEKSVNLRFEREYIKEENPDTFILHPVHGVELSAIKRENRHPEIENCVALFKNYQSFLNKNWDLNKNSEASIRQKFEYMIHELNLFIDSHPAEIPQNLKIQI